MNKEPDMEQADIAVTDIVVIGGSAAGLTAAITARRHYPDKSILLVR
jgi:thioredoxin reductase